MPISGKIDLHIQELQSLLPMKIQDKQRLDKKFRLEFNFNSNHMEGNTLTYNETELLLLFDDVKGNHTLRELEEMKAHDVAYKFIEELAADKERPLTEQVIKNLNEIILVRTFWKNAQTQDGQSTSREIKIGDYKEFSNSVRLQNGEMFHYASPTDTPIKMAELLDWYRKEELESNPLILAAMLHYKFVRIHPFDDGNGLISRLLMNYVLLKHNLPPVVIKSKEKSDYLSALHLADVGDYEAFISYIGEQLEWSLDLSIKAAKGESIEDSDDIDKEIALLNKIISRPSNKVSKNQDTIKTIWENSLKYLCADLFTLAEKFFPLFNESSIQLNIQKGSNGVSVKNLQELGNYLMNANDNILITDLIFIVYYRNMKKTGYSTNFRIDIKFSDLGYSIENYRGITNNLVYDEKIKTIQIDNIISQTGKSLLDELSKHTDF